MMLIKIKNFMKSLFWHIYAGFPKTSKPEILNRYSVCVSCDRFDSVRKECMECGCSINNKSQFFNKLAWADQECPLGKWPRLA